MDVAGISITCDYCGGRHNVENWEKFEKQNTYRNLNGKGFYVRYKTADCPDKLFTLHQAKTGENICTQCKNKGLSKCQIMKRQLEKEKCMKNQFKKQKSNSSSKINSGSGTSKNGPSNSKNKPPSKPTDSLILIKLDKDKYGSLRRTNANSISNVKKSRISIRKDGEKINYIDTIQLSKTRSIATQSSRTRQPRLLRYRSTNTDNNNTANKANNTNNNNNNNAHKYSRKSILHKPSRYSFSRQARELFPNSTNFISTRLHWLNDNKLTKNVEQRPKPQNADCYMPSRLHWVYDRTKI